MLSGETQIRVRYAETDRMGLLHHANYLVYFEQARTELLRELGGNYKDLEDQGYLLVLTKVEVKYRSPAHYDDLLTVRAMLRHLPSDTVTFYMEIYNEKKKLVNGGSVKLCFVDMKTRRPVPPPEFVLEKLRPFF